MSKQKDYFTGSIFDAGATPGAPSPAPISPGMTGGEPYASPPQKLLQSVAEIEADAQARQAEADRTPGIDRSGSGFERVKKTVQRVESGVDAQWIEDAFQCLKELANRQEFLQSYELWELVGYAPGEKRSMAAVMARGKREGIVESTGRREYSNLTTSNPSPTTVWRSLIFKGESNG